MNKPACFILLVEDDEDDFLIIEDLLKNVSFCIVHLVWVSSYEEAITAIHKRPPDILLADYNLNYTHTGIDLVREVKASGAEMPAILVTGQDQEAIGGKEILEVVDGYLYKGELTAKGLEESLKAILPGDPAF